MAKIFAGSEVVDLGIQIEKNGRDFYEILARQTKSDKIRQTFEYLAKEEEKHIEDFKGILKTVEDYQPVEAYPGEYFAYINALASEYVFTKKDKGVEIAKKIKSDKEAIDMGIAFEKDSIIFYEGIKKAVPEYEHKVITKLISQEQNHLAKLYQLKDKI